MTDEASGNPAHERRAEKDTTRSHFFSRTLGDGWTEVEPGIYLQRAEAHELSSRTGDGLETLDDALAGALQSSAGTASAGGPDDHNGRLRRWLHR